VFRGVGDWISLVGVGVLERVVIVWTRDYNSLEFRVRVGLAEF